MRDPTVGSPGRMRSRMSDGIPVTGSWLTRHAHALKPFVTTVIAAAIVAAAAAVATGSSAGSLAENGRIAFGRYLIGTRTAVSSSPLPAAVGASVR
jgi:hypothetical protein